MNTGHKMMMETKSGKYDDCLSYSSPYSPTSSLSSFCSLQEGCIAVQHAVIVVCKVKPKKSSRIFVLRKGGKRRRRRKTWVADVLMSYCFIFINMQRCSSCLCQVTQCIMEGTWINGMTMIMIFYPFPFFILSLF